MSGGKMRNHQVFKKKAILGLHRATGRMSQAELELGVGSRSQGEPGGQMLMEENGNEATLKSASPAQ